MDDLSLQDEPRHGSITPQMIRELPEAVQLVAVQEAAASQSVGMFNVLRHSGIFDLTLPDFSSNTPSWMNVQSLSRENFVRVAAVAYVLRGKTHDFLEVDPGTNQLFRSAVAYSVSLLAVQDDFMEAFDAFVGDFVTQFARTRQAFLRAERDAMEEHNGLGAAEAQASSVSFARLEGAIQAKARVKFETMFEGTCGALLAAAAGMNHLKAMNRLFDALDALAPPLAPRSAAPIPLLQRASMTSSLMVSEDILFEDKNPVAEMIHPAYVALKFNRIKALKLFISRGWQPHSAILSYASAEFSRTHTGIPGARRGTGGSPGEDTRIAFTLPSLLASDKIELMPSMMDALLSGMQLKEQFDEQRLAEAPNLAEDLWTWTNHLITGDEPELEKVAVARKHGLYAHNPLMSFQNAVSSGCAEALHAACDVLDWESDFSQGFSVVDEEDPISNGLLSALMNGRFWPGSETAMTEFTGELVQVLERANMTHLLGGAGYLNGQHLTFLQFVGGLGLPSLVLKALEMGHDPLQTFRGHHDAIKLARLNDHDHVAMIMQSHLAKRAARAAIASLNTPQGIAENAASIGKVTPRISP